MASFTKTYASLGGILTFDVPANLVELIGVPTTVTAEIGASYVLTDTFNITGSAFADVIKTGNGAGNLVNGGAGNDTLTGGTANDDLRGGADNDTIALGGNSTSSNEYAYGGDGHDTITAGAGWVIVYGDAGNDTIDLTGVGVNTGKYTSAYGGADNDAITGSAGIDNLYGDAGDDDLSGGLGNDVLQAGDGSDRLDGGGGDDTLQSIDILGSDTIDGGADTDMLTLTRAGQLTANIVDFSNAAIVQTLGDGTTVVNVEKITFTSGSGADVVTSSNHSGGLGINRVFGGLGNDTLTAGSNGAYLSGDDGNDTLTGGAGIDDLRGGADDDILSLGGNSTGSNEYAYGGDGHDTITAGAGWVIVNGDAGNDTIDLTGVGTNIGKYTSAYGGADNDTITGSDGIDYLYGDAGDDNLSGGLGNDFLQAGSGSDLLDGGGGDDTLQSVDILGGDTIDGGANTDTLILIRTGQLTANIVDFSNAAMLQTLGDGTTVVNVEKVGFTSGSGDDVIASSNNSAGVSGNVVNGGLGNDTLTAGSNGASLTGDDGNDILSGGAGIDELRGGTGDDILSLGGNSTGSNEYAYGGSGRDTITAGAGWVVANGDSGDDAIDLTGVGINTGKYATAHGGSEDDTLTGSLGQDYLYGDGGADWLHDGGGGNDTLQGGNEDDVIISLGGLDTINGGTETDLLTLDRSSAIAALTFVVTSTTATTTLVGDGTTVSSVERFEITGGSAGDTFTTAGHDDSLDGRGGSDTLSGLGGADTLLDDNVANTDADTLNGGDGDDTLRTFGGADVLDGGAGTGDIAVIDRSTAIAALAFAVTGTASPSVLAFDGTSVVNVERFELIGGTDADSFSTFDYADILQGNGGNDSLDGGMGSDTAVFRGARSTSVIERLDGATTTWRLVDTDALTDGDDGTDTLANVETVSFLGGKPQSLAVASLIGALDDANAAANAVAENAVIGTAVGLTGLAADGNSETVSYSLTDNAGGRFAVHAGTGVVTVAGALDFETATSHAIMMRATSVDGSFVEKAYTIGITNASPETIMGTAAADSLSGGTDVDRIFGLGGNDTLSGFAGDDVLCGGAGWDILIGSTGFDHFDFNSIKETGKTASTRDRITDFTHGQDDIDLSTIDASSKTGGNQAFKFIGAKAFSKIGGQLHTTKSGGVTIVEGDTNGDGKADFQIELTGSKTLTAGDFIL